MTHRIALYLLCIFLLSGCDLIKKKNNFDSLNLEEQPLVRVHDSYLYKRDIEEYFSNEDISDSLAVDTFINKWIKEQLLLERAQHTMPENYAEIEKMVEDYRNELILFYYKKGFLKSRGDNVVSDEDIEKYYKANSKRFQLNQNIIKGVFVKIPSNAPHQPKLRKLLTSDKTEDIKELKAYCLSFADNFHLEDTVWINYDELIENTPFAVKKNLNSDVKKLIETKDANNIYFLKILEVKASNELSPLDFVRDKIRNILLTKKRLELLNELEEHIYQQAKENDEFELY